MIAEVSQDMSEVWVAVMAFVDEEEARLAVDTSDALLKLSSITEVKQRANHNFV